MVFTMYFKHSKGLPNTKYHYYLYSHNRMPMCLLQFCCLKLNQPAPSFSQHIISPSAKYRDQAEIKPGEHSIHFPSAEAFLVCLLLLFIFVLVWPSISRMFQSLSLSLIRSLPHPLANSTEGKPAQLDFAANLCNPQGPTEILPRSLTSN